MAVLLVRRHAVSLDNECRRIQGQRHVPGLAPAGHREAQEWARSLPPDAAIGTIWSSDSLRARQTAAAAARHTSVPLVTTCALREVDAGVLQGLCHLEAQLRHPDAYDVWMARGDLDAVPGAEMGDALQARLIAFLAMSTGPGLATDGNQIVVTHAATMRCLVNTSLGRSRATPVAVGHRDRHRLEAPWEALRPETIGATWRPPVHRVSAGTDGCYVVKVQPVRTATVEHGLVRHASLQSAARTPPILATVVDPRCPPGRGVVYSVRRFIAGATVGHRLPVAHEWRLFGFLRNVAAAIGGAAAGHAEIPSLSERVGTALSRRPGESAAAVLRLISDSRVAALIREESEVADLDLHRDNVVETPDGYVKIDFGSLCRGPRLWPEACALVGASALYPSTARYGETDRPHERLLGANGGMAAELRILVALRLHLGLSYFLSADASAAPYAALYRSALAALPES